MRAHRLAALCVLALALAPAALAAGPPSCGPEGLMGGWSAMDEASAEQVASEVGMSFMDA